MGTPEDAAYKTSYDALRKVLSRQLLADKLKAAETTEQARKELGLSEAMATDLKTILNLMPADVSTDSNGSESNLQRQAQKSMDFAREFLQSSLTQVRNAARISTVMSAVMFVVGIGFLLLAAVRSVFDSGNVSSTVVIGGIGIIQLVALFYRSPLREIARAASAAQRANIAIMSYMLGVALVGESVYQGRRTDQDLVRLGSLTEQTMTGLGQEPPNDHRSKVPTDVKNGAATKAQTAGR